MKRAAGGFAVLAFGVLLLVPGLGRMGALDSTDARYLAIGREMWATGDWLVPRLGGVPHLDKPPLTYWAASLGYTGFGPAEFGGRIVEQLALLATAFVVYRAARRFASMKWALPAALVLLTSSLPFLLSRGLATDLFQLLFVTAALVAMLDAATRRSAPHAAAAGALLGVSMLAKGPIALFVAASIWLVFAVAARSRARLPWRGVALGAALFLAIGLPWYALLVRSHPGLLDWFLNTQLANRVTGADRGHIEGATYLLRIWVLGSLPWTPLVALAIARLRPRGRLRDADPVDLFLLAWAIVPVLLFSLFATKLASYIAPAFPGAALLVARAGSRGLLDDRRARRTLTACGGIAVVVAIVAGAGISAESGLGFAAVPSLALHGRRASLFFGLLLVAIGALGVFALRRNAKRETASAVVATAIGAGCVLALVFHAVSPAMPTFREQAHIISSVPGARLIEFSLKPSFFFYADDARNVSVAGVQGVVDPFVDPDEARRLTLSRDDAVALLREDAPTFALAGDGKSAALEVDTGALEVSRRGRYVLLANPAAQRALAANPGRLP